MHAHCPMMSIGADTGRAYLAVAAMYEEDAAFCEWIEHYFLEARDKRNPITTTCNCFACFHKVYASRRIERQPHVPSPRQRFQCLLSVTDSANASRRSERLMRTAGHVHT
jgi:hypothetical protein